MLADPVVVYSDDTLRAVAGLFAEEHITCAPVVDRHEPTRMVGLITVDHLLDARLKDVAEEHHRERPFAERRVSERLRP
ncbi:MAG: CBS domain-containing protein [Pseudonocardiaceae bacterium]